MSAQPLKLSTRLKAERVSKMLRKHGTENVRLVDIATKLRELEDRELDVPVLVLFAWFYFDLARRLFEAGDVLHRLRLAPSAPAVAHEHVQDIVSEIERVYFAPGASEAEREQSYSSLKAWLDPKGAA